MTLLKTLLLIRKSMSFFLISIKTTVMCLTERRLMSFHPTANMTTESSWLVRGFPHEAKFTHCQTINFRKWRSILLKILKKVLLNLIRSFILHQYYLLWRQMRIFNSALITENLMLSWNTTAILYYSLIKYLCKF